MKTAVLLSELAGLRRGEIRGLRWQAVDLDNRVIHVVENVVPNDAPKDGSAGTVPISDDVLSVLEELRVSAFKLGRSQPEEPSGRDAPFTQGAYGAGRSFFS